MRRRAAASAALLAIVLAGCGSTELSDLQLRKRAGAICAAATRRAGRIATPRTISGGAPFLRRGIAVYDKESAALRRLRPPNDLEAEYRGSLDALSRQLDALERTVHSLTTGEDPVSAIKTLQHRLDPLESAADRGWTALQIPACIEQKP